jgi:hypothetical protein|tara:strand:- start:1404 stop:2300 length:897 start_codon:yes stop_codon:yes gene_type:complete
MRYREAYELIDAALNKAEVGFPVTETLKATFFDQEVENIGLRLVKKSILESFTASGKEFVLTDSKRSNKVYKVELEDGTGSTKAVPFIDDAVMFYSTDEDTVSNLAFTLRTDATSGSLSAGTRANPCSITSTAHGLDSGDFVVFSEVVGLDHSTTSVNALNNKRLAVTVTDANTFTVAVNTSSGYGANATAGKWQEDTLKIVFNKTPSTDSTAIRVFYYARPEPKTDNTSRVDLPGQLVPCAIHRTVAQLLNLDGNLQMGSGHRGLAKALENEFMGTDKAREAMPDLVAMPLQDFVGK